jgi:hypothetical protein
VREWLDVEVMQLGASGVLKFVEVSKINCAVEESGCCVLCVRNYRESYVWL